MQLSQAFFDDYGNHFEQTEPSNSRAVHLLITDQITANGNHVLDYQFTANPEIFDMEDLHIRIELPQNLDTSALLKEATLGIFRGVMPFLDLKSREDDIGEDIVVTLQPPKNGDEPQSKRESPFYGDIHGSHTMGETTVNSNNNTSLGVYGSYMGNHWKIQLSGHGTYQKLSVQRNGGTQDANNFSHFQRSITSYSFGKNRKWSIALIGMNQQNPGANIKNKLQVGTGMEWNLVPYRKNENHQFMFRFGGMRANLNLDRPNDLGFTRDQFTSAFVQFSTYWLLAQNKLSITASSFYTQNLKYTDYNAIHLNASTGYQISKSLRLTWNIGYQYQKKSITFPNSPDFSNPLQSTLLSGAPGRTIHQSIGVTINIGNNIGRIRDLRWNGF